MRENQRFTHSELNPAHYKTCYFALSTVTVLEFYQGLALALGEEPRYKKVSIFHQIQGAIANLYSERRITPMIVLGEIHDERATRFWRT